MYRFHIIIIIKDLTYPAHSDLPAPPSPTPAKLSSVQDKDSPPAESYPQLPIPAPLHQPPTREPFPPTRNRVPPSRNPFPNTYANTLDKRSVTNIPFDRTHFRWQNRNTLLSPRSYHISNYQQHHDNINKSSRSKSINGMYGRSLSH